MKIEYENYFKLRISQNTSLSDLNNDINKYLYIVYIMGRPKKYFSEEERKCNKRHTGKYRRFLKSF